MELPASNFWFVGHNKLSVVVLSMENFDLGKFLQRGYYLTLGLTSTLLEMAQDPTKREERLRELDRLADELVAKGVSTEAEARSYVDQVVAGGVNKNASEATVATVATPVREDNSEQELQELTNQIAKLRAELEQLRNAKN
jgi:polyhydroxyalkanoate synthesis regulator phasin